MYDKSQLEQLPSELLNYMIAIGLTADVNSKKALACACVTSSNVMANRVRNVNTLLDCVKSISTGQWPHVDEEANINTVKMILQNDHSLLLETSSFEFAPELILKDITAFDLAIYLHRVMGDRGDGRDHLCAIMIDCIPNDELGEKIKTQLLLTCVAKGQEYLAEKILIENPDLLLKRGDVSDNSGRLFKNITAFELMLWNLDTRYMWKMMQSCIPENTLGDNIKQELLQQYNDVENKGITYLLDGKENTQSYYNYQTLLDSLNDFIDGYYISSVKVCPSSWVKEVGKAQLLAPEHVRQHYTEQSNNFTDPKFKRDEFCRYGWFSSMSLMCVGPVAILCFPGGLGDSFAMYRYVHVNVVVVSTDDMIRDQNIISYTALTTDLEALKMLFAVRIQDLLAIKEELLSPEDSLSIDLASSPSGPGL